MSIKEKVLKSISELIGELKITFSRIFKFISQYPNITSKTLSVLIISGKFCFSNLQGTQTSYCIVYYKLTKTPSHLKNLCHINIAGK